MKIEISKDWCKKMGQLESGCEVGAGLQNDMIISEMRKTAIAKLKGHQSDWPDEEGHKRADDILCELLTAIGYEDVVKEYEKVGKWYA